MSADPPTADRAELPREISPADAVALARALLHELDAATGVPNDVRRAGRAVRDASDALRVAWEASVRGAIARDHGATARRADTDEDAVWLALYHWLVGWSTLPAGVAPERDVARVALDALFPDGARFTELGYAVEWAEADRRIALLDADGHAARIESLGGAVMLRALYQAHAAYERALGVTHDPGAVAGPDASALAPLLAAFHAALARYVDAARGAAGERAAALLDPLRRYHAEFAARRARR